jgi:outer membrane protein assembly factor BamD (BamD/ComL family)
VLGKLILFFVLFIGAIVGIHQSVQTGKMLTFLDRHPHEKYVPPVAYTLGHILYIFHNRKEAVEYFSKILKQYPKSKYADDAMFYRVESWDNIGSMDKLTLADEYQKYLDAFPEGKHAKVVRERIDHLRTS